MNLEQVDRIAFRFTSNELGALLELMGLPALPDTSVIPADPESGTVDSLIDSGIVMACGDRTMVDGTISLVLRNAALSVRRLTAKGKNGQTVLYRGERMCVLAEEADGLVTLEPLQDMRSAREPWLAAAERLEEPVSVYLSESGDLSGEGEGPEALRTLYDQMRHSEE